MKDFIKQQLVQERQKELIEKYIEDLKKTAKITINENLLKEEKPSATPEKPEAKDKTGKEAVSDTPKPSEKKEQSSSPKK